MSEPKSAYAPVKTWRAKTAREEKETRLGPPILSDRHPVFVAQFVSEVGGAFGEDSTDYPMSPVRTLEAHLHRLTTPILHQKPANGRVLVHGATCRAQQKW